MGVWTRITVSDACCAGVAPFNVTRSVYLSKGRLAGAGGLRGRTHNLIFDLC